MNDKISLKITTAICTTLFLILQKINIIEKMSWIRKGRTSVIKLSVISLRIPFDLDGWFLRAAGSRFLRSIQSSNGFYTWWRSCIYIKFQPRPSPSENLDILQYKQYVSFIFQKYEFVSNKQISVMIVKETACDCRTTDVYGSTSGTKI